MVKAISGAKKFQVDGKGGLKAVANPDGLVITQTGGTTPKKTSASAAEKPSRAAATTPAPSAESVDGKKLTYEARMRKLAPIVRVRAKLASTVLRFKNLAEEIGSWTNAADLNTEAKGILEQLESMTDVASSVPDDFAPARDKKARESSLKPGATVALKAKYAATYDGVLETDERSDLEVVDIRKGRVLCKTSAGSKVFIPRGHLELDEEDDDVTAGDDGEE